MQHLAERDYGERSYLLRRYFREFHGLVPLEEHLRQLEAAQQAQGAQQQAHGAAAAGVQQQDQQQEQQERFQ